MPLIEFLPQFDTLKLYWPDSEDFNEKLRAEILQQERLDPTGMVVSNAGGYHSNWQHFRSLIPRIQEAKNNLTRLLHYNKELVLDHVWANINRDGAYNVAHRHHAELSGFYCVDAGGPAPSDGGATVLLRSAKGKELTKIPKKKRPHREYIQPAQKGTMLIFPGSLLHYVTPYHGNGTRITIAFNFQLV